MHLYPHQPGWGGTGLALYCGFQMFVTWMAQQLLNELLEVRSEGWGP